MPTYDYECNQCGRVFEVFQNMSDDPLSSCEECGGAVRRLIGGGLGIIFKGSGFYVTDNKSGSKNPASAGSTKAKGGDSPNSGKTEKKDAAKSTGSKEAVKS